MPVISDRVTPLNHSPASTKKKSNKFHRISNGTKDEDSPNNASSKHFSLQISLNNNSKGFDSKGFENFDGTLKKNDLEFERTHSRLVGDELDERDELAQVQQRIESALAFKQVPDKKPEVETPQLTKSAKKSTTHKLK